MLPAIIPARGGSKGIRNKNLVELNGKPLIAWTIEQAVAAKCITDVIVATDSKEIARVAENYGATYFERSRESATDRAPSERVLHEVLDAFSEEPECVVFLQCTSPIRQPWDIDGAVDRLKHTKADSLFSGHVIHGYTWRLDREGLQSYYRIRQMRQEQLGQTIEENGSIYVFRPEVLRKYNNRLGGKTECYLMHALDSYQVDEPSDLVMMAELMRLRL